MEQGTIWLLSAEEQERFSVKAKTVYHGWGERWASVRFYRACRDGMTDSLVDHVMLLQSGHMVACVVIDHMLRFGVQ